MLSSSLLVGIWLAFGGLNDPAAKTEHPAAAAPGVEEKAGSTAATPHATAEKPAANTAKDKSAKSAKGSEAAKKEPPKRELPPEIANLRDRVRSTLAAYYKQPLNTRDFTAGEILVGCLPFGCQSEVDHDGQSINGITCLCWNYPCAGYELLFNCDGHVGARVGYGLQSYPGQMLAMLALSHVPAGYPLRAGNLVRNVADLVECEKLACRRGTSQSLRLAGLAHYVKKGVTWKDSLGQAWSIDRLVDEELRQPASAVPVGGMLRLVGLRVAVARHSPPKPVPDSPLDRALSFLNEYQRYAFRLQNSDGSWSVSIIDPRAKTNDALGQVRASGYLTSWLTLSLPMPQLTRPEMVRAIDYLSQSLGSDQVRWNLGSVDRAGLDGLMQALNALATYDFRAFKPFDPPAEETKPASGE